MLKRAPLSRSFFPARLTGFLKLSESRTQLACLTVPAEDVTHQLGSGQPLRVGAQGFNDLVQDGVCLTLTKDVLG